MEFRPSDVGPVTTVQRSDATIDSLSLCVWIMRRSEDGRVTNETFISVEGKQEQ